MKKNSIYPKIALLLVLLTLVSACGVTLSPEKRKPLVPVTFQTALPTHSEKLIVVVESTLPDKPLNETVWDNVNGAFWDVQESRQIGFTQNYKKLSSAAMVGGVFGGAIGGAIVGATAGPNLVDTRIVIPFGRIFEENFRSALKQTYPEAIVYSEKEFEAIKNAQGVSPTVVKIKIDAFQVWEKPLNHIHLRSALTSKRFEGGQFEKPVQVHETHKEFLERAPGTVLSTSGSFITEMNSIVNSFAQEITLDILKNPLGS